jgi:hypothetical protein
MCSLTLAPAQSATQCPNLPNTPLQFVRCAFTSKFIKDALLLLLFVCVYKCVCMYVCVCVCVFCIVLQNQDDIGDRSYSHQQQDVCACALQFL